MAAISYPSSTPRPGIGPTPHRERHLRLIPGGRSAPPAAVAPGVYARRRLVALVLAAVLLLAGLVALQAAGSMLVVRDGGAGAGAPTEPPAGSRVHVVQPGETLWGIASSLAGGGEGGDVRATVDRLVEANGGATTLQVGQRLVVG